MGSVRSQRFRSVLIVAVFVLAFTLGATAQANPSAPGVDSARRICSPCPEAAR